MHLDDLSLFIRVANTRSLSEAARQLLLTPAGVSARLQRIEHDLGIKLVERSTRHLRLTAEGEQFLRTCEATAAVWSQGRALLRSGSLALVGPIRIGAPADTSTQFLGPWIAEYARMRPGLHVTLQVADRLHDLRRESVDIAIRYGVLPDSTLVGRVLLRSRRVLVAAPAYLQRHGWPEQPGDLLHHRCLAWLIGDQPKVQWRFTAPDGAMQAVTVRPVMCGDGLLVRQWALRGEGVAYKAEMDVADDLAAGKLVPLLPTHAGEAVPVTALLPGTGPRPDRIRDLLCYLARRFEQIASPADTAAGDLPLCQAQPAS